MHIILFFDKFASWANQQQLYGEKLASVAQWKYLILLFDIFQYLWTHIIKNFISVNEEISVFMQKLVKVLSQRNGLQEFENWYNENIWVCITKATNNLETYQW